MFEFTRVRVLNFNYKQVTQGSTLTFQLTSLVASDNLDVTSQKKFLLATRWCLQLNIFF